MEKKLNRDKNTSEKAILSAIYGIFQIIYLNVKSAESVSIF